MIKKSVINVFLFVLFVGSQLIFSQTKKVVYERNDDKSVTFSYTSDIPGSVYVILKFSQLINATSRVVKETIKGYGGQLVTLQPDNSKSSIGFSYSYRTLRGNVDAKPDTAFKYVLPFKNNRSVKVRDLSYLGKRFGDSEPKNWRSFQFLAQPNDTVYAIRKGLVVSITDNAKADSDKRKEYGYRNKSNRMIIEHEDGTLASYSVLKKGSFMVNIGDTVYPSAPLAIAGSYDKKENSQLRLSIYYLDDIVKDLDFDEKSKERFGSRTHIYAYVNPMFLVNENNFLNLEKNETYKAICSDDIIEEEMSKREKKRWLKKRELIKKR